MRDGQYERLKHSSPLRKIAFEAHSTARYIAEALELYAKPRGAISLPDYAEAIDNAIEAQLDCNQLIIDSQAEVLTIDLSAVRDKVLLLYRQQIPYINHVTNLASQLKQDPRYLFHTAPPDRNSLLASTPTPVDVILAEIKAWRANTELHINRGEVQLRAQLVHAMRKVGLQATSETRSFNGHADIVVENNKNQYDFVAECKLWDGSRKLQETIDQLRNRYLSTEVKVGALVVFTRLKGFVQILESATKSIEGHAAFAGWEKNLDEFGSGYCWLTTVQQNNVSVRTAVIFANLYDGR